MLHTICPKPFNSSEAKGPEGRKSVAGGEAKRTPGQESRHGSPERAKDRHSAALSGLGTWSNPIRGFAKSAHPRLRSGRPFGAEGHRASGFLGQIICGISRPGGISIVEAATPWPARRSIFQFLTVPRPVPQARPGLCGFRPGILTQQPSARHCGAW